jgi:hypothetical protein
VTVRIPPRAATWLLQHLGPRYRNDSLAGDLYEEFQLNRTRAWYWRQVIAAICIGRTTSLRELVRRLSVPSTAVRRMTRSRVLSRLATSAILRVSTEATALLGVMALAEQLRSRCSPGQLLEVASVATLVGGIGLCLSFGSYLSLCIASRQQRTSATRRRTPIRRLMGVFAVTALSAGTLTWASGVPHTPHQCTARANTSAVSLSRPLGSHTRVETHVGAEGHVRGG